jgi:hypothetical protein
MSSINIWSLFDKMIKNPSKMEMPKTIDWKPLGSLWKTEIDDRSKSSLANRYSSIVGYQPVGVGSDYLQVPRFYGADAKKSAQIESMCQTEMQNLLTLALYSKYIDPNDKNYQKYFDVWIKCRGPKDGGTGYDWVLGLGAGDTPICIKEYFPMMLLSMDALNLAPSDEFKKWFIPFVQYVKDNPTAQYNNHRTWKAWFLLLSGHILKDYDTFCDGLQVLHECIEIAIDHDGSFPMELARAEKAASYSLMNLEGMGLCVSIAKLYGIDSLAHFKSRQDGDLHDSFVDFAKFLDTPADWDHAHGTKSNRPDACSDWDWVMLLQKMIYGDCSLKREMSFFGFRAIRSYSFLFPELRNA